MARPVFKKIEFYITNVCNLTCDQCNRFNNFEFKGWQRWADYEDTYRRWAELIDVRAMTLMGGEPLLNPSVLDWITGVNDIFGIDVQVLTNGTRLLDVNGLYDIIAFNRPRNGVRNQIAVSLHNLADLDQLVSDIHEFLRPPIYQNQHNPEAWGCDYQFSDSNGVVINVWYQNTFDTASIQRQQGVYRLWNNDPAHAHSACVFAKFKSYHFVKGRLYKCGPVALMPEFDAQHRIELTEQDRALLHAYEPLTVENWDRYHEEFLQALDDPIPQCKFCPVEKTTIQISPLRKGSNR